MKPRRSNPIRRLLAFIFIIGAVAVLIATYPHKNLPLPFSKNTTDQTSSPLITNENTAQVSAAAADVSKIIQQAATANKFERIFYYAPRHNDTALESLRENINKIDILAPQTYVITENLTASGTVSTQIKEAIKGSNVKLMPLIANNNFSQEIIHRFLASSTAQDKIIEFMVMEAKTNHYIGWQFDLEHIYYTDRDAYSEFVEKAKKSFTDNNLILSIAAVSRIDDKLTDFYKNWSGAFDYERLARPSGADFISIMTYDDPAQIGPTASMPFVRGVYNYIKDKIPPEKLSLGVPLYSWSWSIRPLKRVKHEGTYQQMLDVKSTYTYTEGYNTTYGNPYISYYINGKRHVLWYENDRSIKEKIDFAKQNSLRGFSAWVLGVENPKIWEAVE